MTNEERKTMYMNRNIKAFPLYMALTWDVFFIWTISTMFLTNVKGLSYSQAVQLDSLLMLFGCIMCIPINKLFSKVSPVVASRIAGLGYAGFIILYIVGNSYPVLVLAQFFIAFGYVINSVCVNTILTDSLSEVKRDRDYSRVYGKGMSLYYIIETFASFVVTYMYSVSPYFAFYVALGIVIISELLSLLIKDRKKFQTQNVEVQSVVQKPKDNKKPDSYFKIMTSGFVVAMLVYMFFFRGITSVSANGFKIFLQALLDNKTIPMWSFGLIYGMAKICASIASKQQFKYDLKLGVRCLLILNFLLIFSYLVCGLIAAFVSGWLAIILIIAITYIQYSLRSVNTIFVNNYMQVCVAGKNVSKLYQLRVVAEYLGNAIITAVYAALLSLTGDSYAYTNIIYACIFAIPMFVAMIVFIRVLVKKHAQKYTIIKEEYADD